MLGRRLCCLVACFGVAVSTQASAITVGAGMDWEVFDTTVPAPIGMGFLPDGDLLVTSATNPGAVHRIDIVGGENAGVSVFATRSDFYYPQYVAVDANGYVFTSRSNDVGNGLFRISGDGLTIQTIGSGGNDTRGLAFNANGSLFASNVIIYSQSSYLQAFVRRFTFDAASNLTGQSNVLTNLPVRPLDLVFDSAGNLFYAGDETVAKVEFDAVGNVSTVTTFATLPADDPASTTALGMGIDVHNNLYVGQTTGTVFKIDPAGTVSTFASGFMQPRDIAVDTAGNVYVSDYTAGQVIRIYADQDADGYRAEVDCDDLDSSIYPGAPELCDGRDNDCDGLLGPGELDADGDGYRGCNGDCDDADATVNPAAYELPGNTVDENCDGSLGACDPTQPWRNHGHFVRCVAHETDALIDQGVLTQEEGDALISAAAQSDVGKK